MSPTSKSLVMPAPNLSSAHGAARGPGGPWVRRAVARVLRAGPLLALLAFVLGTLGACGDPPTATVSSADVRVEPARLVFHPDTESVTVRVVNTGEAPLQLSGFGIEATRDWEAFDLDPLDAAILRPNQDLSFRVRLGDLEPFTRKLESIVFDPDSVDPLRFGTDAKDDDRLPEGEYRDGGATLSFVANGVPQRVPIAFEDPGWLWQYAIPGLVKILLIVLAFVMPLASLLTWMERKQSAMMQDRIGPNMARIEIGKLTLRLWGLLHIATDAIKMLFKEDFIPRRAHRVLYTWRRSWRSSPRSSCSRSCRSATHCATRSCSRS
jgi:hypothetical protein